MFSFGKFSPSSPPLERPVSACRRISDRPSASYEHGSAASSSSHRSTFFSSYSSGWTPSDADAAWIDRVSISGNALLLRRQQDVAAGVGSAGLRPKSRKPAASKPKAVVCSAATANSTASSRADVPAAATAPMRPSASRRPNRAEPSSDTSLNLEAAPSAPSTFAQPAAPVHPTTTVAALMRHLPSAVRRPAPANPARATAPGDVAIQILPLPHRTQRRRNLRSSPHGYA